MISLRTERAPRGSSLAQAFTVPLSPIQKDIIKTKHSAKHTTKQTQIANPKMNAPNKLKEQPKQSITQIEGNSGHTASQHNCTP